MKQETPTNPANPANTRSSTSEPKKEEAERTADTIKVLGGTVNRGIREPTLLDSRGEPVVEAGGSAREQKKDASREPASGKESIMASTNAENTDIARKASAVVGQVGEG